MVNQKAVLRVQPIQEQLWSPFVIAVKLTLINQRQLIIIAFYNQPSSKQFCLDQLKLFLTHVCKDTNENVILLGDFNEGPLVVDELLSHFALVRVQQQNPS